MSGSQILPPLTLKQLELVPFIAEYANAEWQRVRSEKPYAFFLCSAPEGHSVCAASATEDSLTAIGSRYLNEYGYVVRMNADAMQVARSVLRWANPDDGWLYHEGEQTEQVSQRLLSAIRSDVFEECDGTIHRICTEALRELDRRCVFGEGKERLQATIGFWYYSASDRELFESIRACNPADVAVQAASDILRMIQNSEYFGRRFD